MVSSIYSESNKVYFVETNAEQYNQELPKEIKFEEIDFENFFSECIHDKFVNSLGTWIYDMSQHPLPALGPKGFERLEKVLKTKKKLKKKYLCLIPEVRRNVLRKKLDEINWKYVQANLKSPFKIGTDPKGDYISIEVPMNTFDLIFYILQRHSHIIEMVQVYGGAGSWIPHPEYYEKCNRTLQLLGRKKELSEEDYSKLDIQPPDLDMKFIVSQATNDESNLIYISILDYFISIFPVLNDLQNDLRIVLSEILFSKKSVIYSEEAGRKNDFSILAFRDTAGFDVDISIVKEIANNQLFNCHGWSWDIKEVIQKNQFNGSIILYPIADASQGWQAFFDKVSRTLSVVDIDYPYHLGWEKFIVFISRGYSSPNSELERNLQKNLNVSNLTELCNNLIKCSSEHHLKGRLNATIVLLNASIYLEKLPQKDIQFLWEYFKNQEERFKDNSSTPLWINSLIQAIIDGSLQIKDIISILQMVTFLVEISQISNLNNFWNSFDEYTTYKHISFKNSGSIKIPYNFSEVLNKINDFLSCERYFNNPFFEQICSNLFGIISEFSSFKNLELKIYDNEPTTSQIKTFFRFVLCSISFHSTEDSKVLVKEAYELITSDIDINLKSFCFSVLKDKLCKETVFENFEKVLCNNFAKEIALIFFIKDLVVKEIDVAYEIWKKLKNELSEKYYIIIGRIISPNSLSAFIEVLINVKEISNEDSIVYKQFVLKCSKNLLSLDEVLDLVTATHLMMKSKSVNRQEILNISKNLLIKSKTDEVWNLIVAFKNKNESLDRDLQLILLTCLKEKFKNKDISIHSLFTLWKKGLEDSLFKIIVQEIKYVSFLNHLIERCLEEKEEAYAELVEKELSLQKDDFSKTKLVEIVNNRLNKKIAQNLSIERELKSYSRYIDERDLIIYLCYFLRKNVEQGKIIDSFDTIFDILRLSKKSVPSEIKECFFDILKIENLLKDPKAASLCFNFIAHPQFRSSLTIEEIKKINILISAKTLLEKKGFKSEEMFFISNAIELMEVDDREYALHFIPYILFALNFDSFTQDIIKALKSKKLIIFTILYDLGRHTDICSLLNLMNIASSELIAPEICSIAIKSVDVIFENLVSAEVHNLIFQCLVICIKKNKDDSSIYALIKKMIAFYISNNSEERLNSILQILFIQGVKNYSKEDVFCIIRYFSKFKIQKAFIIVSQAYEKKIISSEETLGFASEFVSSCVDNKNDRVCLEIFQWINKKKLILNESFLSDFLTKKIKERCKEGFELILELFVTLPVTSLSLWNFVITEKNHIDKELLNRFFVQLSNVILSGNLEDGNIDEIYKLCQSLFEYSKSNPIIMLKILSGEIKAADKQSETGIEESPENQKSLFLISKILTDSQLEYEKKIEFLHLCFQVILVLFKKKHVSDSEVIFIICFKIKSLKIFPKFTENNIIHEVNQEILNYSLTTTSEICYEESCCQILKILKKNQMEFINNPLCMNIVFNYPKIIKKNNSESELIEDAICLILKKLFKDFEKSSDTCLNICKAFRYTKSNKILSIVSLYVLKLLEHIENDIEPPEFLGDLLKGIFSCCSSPNSLEILKNRVFIKLYDSQFQNKGWIAYLLLQNKFQYPDYPPFEEEKISQTKAYQLRDLEITLKEQICITTKNNIFRIKNFDTELKIVWNLFWNNIFFLYEYGDFKEDPLDIFGNMIFNIFLSEHTAELISNKLPVDIKKCAFDNFPFNSEAFESIWKKKKFIDLKNEFISLFFSKKLILNSQMTFNLMNLVFKLIESSILCLNQKTSECRKVAEKTEIAEMVESFAFYSLTLRNDRIFKTARLFAKELCMFAFFHDVFENLEKKLATCIFIVDLVHFDIRCESDQKKIPQKIKKKILSNLIDKIIEMKNPTALRHGVALLCKVGSLFKKNEIIPKLKKIFEEVAVNAYEPTNYFVFEITKPPFKNNSLRCGVDNSLLPVPTEEIINPSNSDVEKKIANEWKRTNHINCELVEPPEETSDSVPLHEAVRALIMNIDLPLFNAIYPNNSKVKGFDRMGFQLMKLYAHTLLNTNPTSDFQIIFSVRFKKYSIIQTILNIIKTGAEFERFYDSYENYFNLLLGVQPMLFEWMSNFVDFEKLYRDYENLLFIEFMDKDLDILKIKSNRLSVIQKWFLLVFSKGGETIFNRVRKTLLLAFKHKLYLEQNALLDQIRPLLDKKF